MLRRVTLSKLNHHIKLNKGLITCRQLAEAIERAGELAKKAWGGVNWTTGVATMMDAVCGADTLWHEEEVKEGDLIFRLDGTNDVTKE